MALLVTYELRGPREAYQELFAELKRHGPWWHHLVSTWVIATEETPGELWQYLGEHLIEGDRLLILQVEHPPRQGWLTQRAWKWLRTYL